MLGHWLHFQWATAAWVGMRRASTRKAEEFWGLHVVFHSPGVLRRHLCGKKVEMAMGDRYPQGSVQHVKLSIIAVSFLIVGR